MNKDFMIVIKFCQNSINNSYKIEYVTSKLVLNMNWLLILILDDLSIVNCLISYIVISERIKN